MSLANKYPCVCMQKGPSAKDVRCSTNHQPQPIYASRSETCGASPVSTMTTPLISGPDLGSEVNVSSQQTEEGGLGRMEGGSREGKGGKGGTIRVQREVSARREARVRACLLAELAALRCTSCPLTLCGHGARSTLSWRTGLRHNVCGTCQAGYTASSITDTTQGVLDTPCWLHLQFYH